MLEETARFTALDATGKSYVVIERRERIDTSTLDGGKSFSHGLPGYRLADGRALNRVDERSFEIVQTAERLVRKG